MLVILDVKICLVDRLTVTSLKLTSRSNLQRDDKSNASSSTVLAAPVSSTVNVVTSVDRLQILQSPLLTRRASPRDQNFSHNFCLHARASSLYIWLELCRHLPPSLSSSVLPCRHFRSHFLDRLPSCFLVVIFVFSFCVVPLHPRHATVSFRVCVATNAVVVNSYVRSSGCHLAYALALHFLVTIVSRL